MNFFHHKGLGNHLLQLCPKVVKHPVYDISCVSNTLNCTLLINIIKYISGYLTPCSRVRLDNLVVSELVKNFLSYYKNRRFITTFL